MRSKTYMSKIILQRGKLTVENRKSREKKTDMLRSFRGIRGVSPGEEMVSYSGKDLQKRKVLSLE